MPKLVMESAESPFFNRELSWLAFNERVLEEAQRLELPVLERLKFLAITASNLDEFFMVRVGALQWLRLQGRRVRDASGMTPTQQWDAIEARVGGLIVRQQKLLREELLPTLAQHGIRRLAASELTSAQRERLEAHFLDQIHPVLSPIALADGEGAALPALQINLLFSVGEGSAEDEGSRRWILISLPPSLPRHLGIAEVDGLAHAYMNLEDVVEMFLPHFFPSEAIGAVARFRISRNGDIAADDENVADLASEMEGVLEKRVQSPAIRIEIQQGAPAAGVEWIRRQCVARQAQVFNVAGELDLSAYFALAALPGFDELKVDAWQSHTPALLEPGMSLFEVVARGDVLLHHPYDSFEPVVKWIEEAALDPQVVGIKQILYRTARNSRIVAALIRAAEAGKQVTVLVELKARFDEARNLDRAQDLLNAGAQIIYGVRGLKTHAKICMILRREGARLIRYLHLGTGNYNEASARLYGDVSYLTCRPEYGKDASAFFNTVTGRSRFVHFQRLSMAPFGLRERLLGLIRSEAERARQGEEAGILLKMNSLEDREMIEALYEASAAGVKIRLNVRGICCLRPGVPGLSERISVVSIIDRYLEHARIYAFRQGGRHAVFISSADFMRRNLSKRVELLVPIEDREARSRLIQILETHFEDQARGRWLQPDGAWKVSANSTGRKAIRSQEVFAREAAKRARVSGESPDVLVPHTPQQAR